MRPSRALAAGAAGLILAAVLMATSAAVLSSSLLGEVAGAPSPGVLGAPGSTASIPPAMLRLYEAATTTCAGLPWTVLAAIGTVESDNGTSDLPGVHSGANAAGAEGPMQFEPSTFAAYDQPVPPGGASPPSPYDPTDAVYAAARDLCANGAENGANLSAAVFAYNHSDSYVSEVLDLAQFYSQTEAQTVAGVTAGGVAVAWALAQVGTPYVWGGETPGVGFDCSGLVQAAYKVAGITLPRVAQDQYDATTKLGPGGPLQPGDLIFFGGGPTDVTHVGIYIGNGQMVDAPSTGADVRVEETPTTPGASWGTDLLVGITDPAA